MTSRRMNSVLINEDQQRKAVMEQAFRCCFLEALLCK